jgi:diguanylate cyclase (GGDEF)-like protein
MTTPTRPDSPEQPTLAPSLDTLWRLVEVLSDEHPREERLAKVCSYLEGQLPGVRCAVMLHQPYNGRLELGAAPTLPERFCAAIDRLRVGPFGASAGSAVHHREPVYVETIATDERWQGLEDSAREHGITSCWSMPIFRQPQRSNRSKDILGTLDLYFTEPPGEDGELRAALERAAGLVRKVVLTPHRPGEGEPGGYDALTGLPNRSIFWSRLRQLIEERRDDPSRFAVVVLDLDQLKNINDTLGFKMGDLVLQVFGQRLYDVVRSSDTVARIGGDEFGMLLQELEQDDDIAIVARRLMEQVSSPYDFDGHDLFLTASVGLSVYPWDGMDEHSLLRNAETALQFAKERGGGDYQLFRPAMVSSKPTFESWWESSKLGSELRSVLERDELELYYQLKFAAKTQKVCGAEALLRWNHPLHGLVSPGRFIPMAEQSGIILPIGEWVLETACRQAKKWQDSGLATIPISVNVSAQQFRHGRLVDRIKEILHKVGLDARLLELEITERLAMEDRGQNLTRLQELHSLGLALSIDDFGTGFSSLSYLHKFPIDTLKIDKSFVSGLGRENEGTAIVRTIIAMAKNLSLRTVAEGVETEAQYRFLLEEGCDAIQGYYFGRPLPASEVTKLLISRS